MSERERCPQCRETFGKRRELNRHMRNIHHMNVGFGNAATSNRCPHCNVQTFRKTDELYSHLRSEHNFQKDEYRLDPETATRTIISTEKYPPVEQRHVHSIEELVKYLDLTIFREGVTLRSRQGAIRSGTYGTVNPQC
eukprot:gb/GECG01013014.1/.p1 GENE.gb/GECG01013014.1/~~gb/GECG01013014.1/.p1  ORF type:complete len:138 (+),score=8.50 gb/GECG01013014.1/:1-414(+)